MKERKRMLIVVNPCSGKGKARKCIGKIVNWLSEAGYVIDVCFTTAHGEAGEIVSQLAKECDCVVCVGGDGTVNEVVNGMIEGGIDKPLGYIPMGCTNDFARSLGIPRKLKKVVKQIASGEPKAIDVCKVNDKYFAYVASFGLFAKSSSTGEQKLKNRLGYLAYVLLGAREIWNAPVIKTKFKTSEEELEGEYILGAVCNTRSVGGIIKLKDEEAQLNDGKFELLCVNYPKSLWQMFRTLRDMKKRRWNSDRFLFRSVEKLTVESISTDYWSLDGEKFICDGKNLEFGILPSAIKILN